MISVLLVLVKLLVSEKKLLVSEKKVLVSDKAEKVVKVGARALQKQILPRKFSTSVVFCPAVR